MHAANELNTVVVADDPALIASLRSAGVQFSAVATGEDRLPSACDVVIVDARGVAPPQGVLDADHAVAVAVINDGNPMPAWADDVWKFNQSTEETAARWRLSTRLAAARRENQRLTDELQRTATTDALTGLLNRNGLLELLEHVWARSRRSGRPLACVMFDLDRFKQVNDQHGHLAGDAAIIAAAKAIRRAGREGDVAARYGGDEFCVLLPECDLAGAELRARRTAEEIGELQIPTDGPPVRLSVSHGAAVASPDHRESTDLIHAADMALLAAKRGAGALKGRTS